MFAGFFARILQSYKTHLREFWAVILLISLAGALRLSRLPERITWNGDTARDMLVARHLSLYNEPLQLGHSAYGLRISSDKNVGDPYGMSHYPSYYFRAMAVVWSVTGNVLNLSIMVVLYHLLGLLVLYLGLRQVVGAFPAWCALVVISLSLIAIEHSLAVAIHPALPLFYVGLALLITGIKQKKIWLLTSAALWCILATTVHYSFLWCFVWVVGCSLIWLIHEQRHKQAVFFGIALGVTGAGLFLALHLEVIRFYGFWPFVGTFTGQYTSSARSFRQLQQQIGTVLLYRLQGIFYAWRNPVVALSVGVIGACLSARKDTRVLVGGLAAFAVSLVILVASKSLNTFHNEQVLFFDYSLMILIGVSFGLIFQQSSKEMKGALGIFAAVGLLSITALGYQQTPYLFSLPIESAQSHAQELIEKSPYPLEDTEFYVTSYYSWDYETPTVVFWLEELSGKKLIKLTEAYNNLSWEGEPKKHMIASCQRFPTMPAMENASCVTFLQHFSETGTYTLEKELFSNQNYRAFLFTVK